MEDKLSSSLITGRIFRWFLTVLSRNRCCLAGSLGGGFLAYLFAFTNKLPNHDDVYWLFTKGTTLHSGRWGLIPLSQLFPDYSMPWIYGVLSLLILSIGICLLVKLLQIREPVLQLLVSAAIVCFPSQICTYTYMFTACAYAVAFSLMAAAVCLVRRGGMARWAAALVCAVYSVGIYQAYIALAAAVLILLLIQDLLTTRESVGTLFRRGIGYVIFLGVTMAFYWLISKLLWKLSGTGMGEYASYAFSFAPEALLDGVRLAYTTFLEVLRYGINGLMPTGLSRLLHLLCLLAVGLEVLLWMLREKDLLRGALMLFLLALLPLAMNCMYLFVAPDAVHTLVLYSYAAFYLLFAVVAQLAWQEGPRLLVAVRQLAREGLVLAMLVITLSNIYIANEAYLNMHLAYENTYAVTTALISQVRALPDYTPQEPVAILGKYQQPEYYHTYFSRLERLMGTKGIDPGIYSIAHFWEYYCGYPITTASSERMLALAQTEEYASMPAWPAAGCVRRVEDTIVIKFS